MAMQKRRKFTTTDKDGKTLELAIQRPNQMVLNEADLHYNVNLNKAIRMGSMTRAEVLQMMEDRKLWTNKDDKKTEEIRKSMAIKERQLQNKGISKSKGIKAAEELKAERDQLVSHLGRKNSYLNNTAEYYAENIREQFIAAACTIVADTEDSFFEDFEDYLNRSDEIAATDSYREAIYMINGFDAMEHNNLAENKYLIDNGKLSADGFSIDDKGRKVTSEGRIINDDYRFVDEDGNLIDEYGEKIDEDGNPIFKEEPKKVGRPKKKE